MRRSPSVMSAAVGAFRRTFRRKRQLAQQAVGIRVRALAQRVLDLLFVFWIEASGLRVVGGVVGNARDDAVCILAVTMLALDLPGRIVDRCVGVGRLAAALAAVSVDRHRNRSRQATRDAVSPAKAPASKNAWIDV